MNLDRLPWLRRWIEKLIGIWYEGVEPPRRLNSMVADFEALHPSASAAEWRAFAIRLIRTSYQTGFARGFEYEARQLALPDPDAIADREQPGWRDNSPPVSLLGEGPHYPPSPIVPVGSEEERIMNQLAERKRTMGR